MEKNYSCAMCEDPISGLVWRWESGGKDAFLCEECADTLVRNKHPDMARADKSLRELDASFLKDCGITPWDL